ncbi:hypothetical protein J1N35_041317 [Gossypium stocksii]|uniref:Uncharacterized protein n=1 Tax=Gossypium stocksii TaxID=47602 RepID=A0A9D3UF89_9ROSI|nr:hypothetical protein J1N35_041317 [Gossypium stocksii]
MPSCDTTEMFNSEVLSNMSDMMAQIMKMVQEISEALPTRKEVVPNFCNFDYEDPCTIVNHDEIHVEVVSDPIDIVADVITEVEVKDKLAIDKKLQPILNESVEESIHFLTVVGEVL